MLKLIYCSVGLNYDWDVKFCLILNCPMFWFLCWERVEVVWLKHDVYFLWLWVTRQGNKKNVCFVTLALEFSVLGIWYSNDFYIVSIKEVFWESEQGRSNFKVLGTNTFC